MTSDPIFLESPIGILLLGQSGEVLDANPVGLQALTRSRESVVGSTLLDWIHPSDQGRSNDHLRTLSSGDPQVWKARIRRGDGLPRLLAFRGVPRGSDSSPSTAVLFIQEAGAASPGRPETDQLQALLDTLPGLFTLTLDTDGRVRHSSGLERTHFLDSRALLGHSYGTLVGGEREGEESMDRMMEEVRSGRSWAGRQWHRRQDGPSFPAKVYATPHRDPRTGQLLGLLVAGLDDSSTHRWRDQAERAQPLAQIGSLSTGIAQRIARALTGLEETVVRLGLPHGAAAREADTIRAEITHFRRFLEAVAEFGNRGTLRRRLIPLPDILREALDGLAPRLASLGIRPALEIPEEVPPVYADGGYVKRILEILLENAVDAVEESSEPFMRLEISHRDDGVLLWVTNTPPGDPEEWLEERIKPSFTTPGGRPGLGLAVAQGMARAHDGRLWAEMPEPGALRLALELPREAPARVREFRPVPLDLSRARRVLLVEEDRESREATQRFLAKLGYEVQEAWSGRSALAQLTNGRFPEIVLSDLRTSDGTGAWFLEEVDRVSPRLLSRTVLLADDPEYESSQALSRKVGCPLVRKPIDPCALLEVLDQVCRNR